MKATIETHWGSGTNTTLERVTITLDDIQQDDGLRLMRLLHHRDLLTFKRGGTEMAVKADDVTVEEGAPAQTTTNSVLDNQRPADDDPTLRSIAPEGDHEHPSGARPKQETTVDPGPGGLMDLEKSGPIQGNSAPG